MNQMMKGQLNQYEVQSAMILGIACGNGLEHVDTDLKFTKEFTKIADKNMPRYAKISQDKAKIKKGKKA